MIYRIWKILIQGTLLSGIISIIMNDYNTRSIYAGIVVILIIKMIVYIPYRLIISSILRRYFDYEYMEEYENKKDNRVIYWLN